MTKLSPDEHLNIYEADYDSLKSKPFRWGEKIFNNNHFMTENKKANLFIVENKNLSEQRDKEFPFILLTGRVKDQWHSGSKTAQLKELLKEDLDFIEISSQDAKELKLSYGDRVKVISKRGKIVAKVKIAPINPKTLFIPISHRGVNYLTNDLLDSLSFEPDYNHSAVRLVKLD
jgi:ferredoxin-nitrate reductase